MEIWSNHEPRLAAANTPNGMPMRTAIKMAQTASSIVAGNSVRNSLSTGCLVTSDEPISPWNMRATKSKYCTQIGRSKPNWAISSACRSGERPRSPAISMTGSPGNILTKPNATRVMPIKVGTITSSLLRTNRIIQHHQRSRRKGGADSETPRLRYCVAATIVVPSQCGSVWKRQANPPTVRGRSSRRRIYATSFTVAIEAISMRRRGSPRSATPIVARAGRSSPPSHSSQAAFISSFLDMSVM